MKKVLIFVITLILIYNSSQAKVTGGRSINITEAPWQVPLARTSSSVPISK